MAAKKKAAPKKGASSKRPPKRPDERIKNPRTGLTPKRQRFVAEYLIDMNGTQAAIRAKYSAKTAGSQAEYLLRNVDVAAAIKAAQAKTAEKLEVTKEMIVDELRKIAFADLRKAVAWGPRQCNRADEDGVQVVSSGVTLFDSCDLDDDTAAAVAEVGNTREGVKIKLHDKKGALVDLAKMLGFMVEKHEHTGKDGGPIETVTKDMTPEQRRDEIKRLLADNPSLIQHIHP